MECRYCQTSNNEDDHRCRRCGRRLRNVPVYAGSSAAAPALSYDASEAVVVSRTGSAEPLVAARKTITYQPSLFSSRELPRVVPFESIAPGPVEPAVRKAPAAPPRQRPRKVIAGQQSLEFSSQARPARATEGAIYCDAPVAITTHRALAAALDGALILSSLGLFGVVFRVAGGEMVLNARTIPVFLAVAAGVMIFYRLLWCCASGDSPGMRWAQLGLINFDGQVPTRKQRLTRAASGFLSLAAGGLGLLWAMVDEETLTWHDHISKTFPTPK
jgi:uncharacterized RDD family membrane protein YckC